MKAFPFRRLLCFILCSVFSLTMLCACVGEPATDPLDPTPGITTPDDGKDDPDDGKDNPDDGKNDPDDGKNDPDDGKDDPEQDDAERYSFRPVISDVMPVIYINTDDGKNDFATVPDREMKLRDQIEYVSASITVEDGENVLLEDIAASVKARGNYTLEYEKKPLRIKFDKKQSMLGLNDGRKFKNWVLLADWKDLSMSNNTTALYFGKTILGSDGYYSSDYRNVELYLNGQYWGVYLLTEQQEAKGEDGRTSIPEVDDDYAGTDIGYFVEYDGYYTDERNMPNNAGDPTFELTYGYHSLQTHYDNWVYPYQYGYTVKSDIYSNAQLTFIRNYMENAYKIMYEAAYNHKLYKFNDDYTGLVATSGTVQEVVSAVIDVQSLVDTYILNEIAVDPDIEWSSFYIGLDMTEIGSKKLIFEAPWDFDSAFGIKELVFGGSRGMFAGESENPWLVVLVREDWFQDMVRAKWAELMKYDVPKTALELIVEQKTVYESYYAKNYERWRNRIIYGNGELVWELNTYTTQRQAADYLYDWLHSRLNYFNEKWGDGTDVLAEKSIQLSIFSRMTYSEIDLIPPSERE